MSQTEEDSPLKENDQIALKIKYLKLRRITDLNNKLKEELLRERITASNASLSIVNFTTKERDYTLPELWGYPPPGSNHFRDGYMRQGKSLAFNQNVQYGESGCCCAIM